MSYCHLPFFRVFPVDKFNPSLRWHILEYSFSEATRYNFFVGWSYCSSHKHLLALLQVLQLLVSMRQICPIFNSRSCMNSKLSSQIQSKGNTLADGRSTNLSSQPETIFSRINLDSQPYLGDSQVNIEQALIPAIGGVKSGDSPAVGLQGHCALFNWLILAGYRASKTANQIKQGDQSSGSSSPAHLAVLKVVWNGLIRVNEKSLFDCFEAKVIKGWQIGALRRRLDLLVRGLFVEGHRLSQVLQFRDCSRQKLPPILAYFFSLKLVNGTSIGPTDAC